MSELPVGQTRTEWRRFGLGAYVDVRAQISARPTVWVYGAVRRPAQLDLAELTRLSERRVQTSDLHCVTTWSATDIAWGGVPFAAVHEYLVDRVGVDSDSRWATFFGLDGYRSCSSLEDALGDDVLLADELDGAPLSEFRGGPARLVSPSQYGYKSVRQVCAIQYRHNYDGGSAGRLSHPRGRVARKERTSLPFDWALRPLWSRRLPEILRRYGRDEPVQ